MSSRVHVGALAAIPSRSHQIATFRKPCMPPSCIRCMALPQLAATRREAEGDAPSLDGAGRVPARLPRAIVSICKWGAVAAVAGVALHLLPHPLVASAATELPVTLPGALADASLADRLTRSGFFQAFSLVFVSEIGDKTFFIAALLAAKTSRLVAFAGAVGALAVMTVLAVLIGVAFHAVPAALTSTIPFDDYVAVAAFLFFGLNTLKDAYQLPDDSSGIDNEKEEAEEEVKKVGTEKKASAWALILQTFSLVFAAEFGDRSFLTTIALGAAQNPLSVGFGALAAHASATGIAVAGGALLSQYISEKVVGYIGGSLFIVFALTTAVGIF
ncbi:unnamed protein product [Phaeothamnion confervicola]